MASAKEKKRGGEYVDELKTTMNRQLNSYRAAGVSTTVRSLRKSSATINVIPVRSGRGELGRAKRYRERIWSHNKNTARNPPRYAPESVAWNPSHGSRHVDFGNTIAGQRAPVDSLRIRSPLVTCGNVLLQIFRRYVFVKSY